MRFVQQFLACLRGKRTLAPLSESLPELEQWFDSELGRAILKDQTALLEEELSCMFGYHLVQLSVSRSLKLFDHSRILHCVDIAPKQGEQNHKVSVVSEVDNLPLDSESVDVSILHHVLEYSQNPHAVLKEAARVTIPKGYIIIFGFNPFSVMGLIKPFASRLTSNAFWQRDSLRRSRISDWLKLLDCETKRQRSGFYHFPVNRPSYLQRFQSVSRFLQRWCMPFGSFYCIVAQKDVQCMTPIKPKWEKESLLGGVPASRRAATANSAARLVLIKSSSMKINDKKNNKV